MRHARFSFPTSDLTNLSATLHSNIHQSLEPSFFPRPEKTYFTGLLSRGYIVVHMAPNRYPNYNMKFEGKISYNITDASRGNGISRRRKTTSCLPTESSQSSLAVRMGMFLFNLSKVFLFCYLVFSVVARSFDGSTSKSVVADQAPLQDIVSPFLQFFYFDLLVILWSLLER
jgi:hypothetical protein